MIYPIRDGSRFGYINARGEVVVTPKLRGARPMYDGLARVLVGKEWGFLDESGCMAFTLPGVAYVCDFENKYAIVFERHSGDGPARTGIVDQTGRYAVPIADQLLDCVGEGMACCSQSCQGPFGYVGLEGQPAISPQYQEASEFACGLAPVRLSEGRWAYIDHGGGEVFAVDAVWADSFAEGLACAYRKIRPWHVFVRPDGSEGCATSFEPWTETPRTRAGSWFSQGRLAVWAYDLQGYLRTAEENPESVTANGDEHRSGYLNTTGALAIPPEYGSVSSFAEGRAAVIPLGGKRWGYIDLAGRMVVEPRYDYVSPYHGGLALVAVLEPTFDSWLTGVRRVRYSYIDPSGKTIFEGAYRLRTGFEFVSDILAPVDYVRTRR